MGSGLLGAYFGIVVDSMYLNGTPADVNKTSTATSILRGIVITILSNIILLPYYLLTKDMNLLVLYIFRSTIPMFCVAFFLYSYLKVILIKFGLIRY